MKTRKLNKLFNQSKPQRQPNIPPRKNSNVYNYRSSRKATERHFDRFDDSASATNAQGKAGGFFRYVLGTIILIILIYLTLLLPQAELKKINSSIITRPDHSYQNALNDQLGSSLANYSKLTIDSKKISQKTRAKFPEISSIDIIIPLLSSRPKAQIVFSAPAIRLKALGDSYILDQEGRAVTLETEVAKGVDITNLITVSDSSDQKITLGAVILTKQQMEFINHLVFQAKQKNLIIELINLTGGATQINVKYKDTNYFVKYSYITDPRQSSGAFFALREQLIKDNIAPREYVDLRIPDRAYIK